MKRNPSRNYLVLFLGALVALVTATAAAQVACSAPALPAGSSCPAAQSAPSLPGATPAPPLPVATPAPPLPTVRSAAQPGAAAQPTTPAAQPQAPEAVPDPDMVIGRGDLLQVGVFGAPDFDHHVRVSAKGDISLPLLGAIQVAGMTVRAAELELEQRLAAGGFFNDPHVSIFVREYATQGISVLGEVQKPGMYSLLGNRRLLDVISAAGGTTPKAGNTVTITHREQPHAPETLPLPLGSSDAQANVQVQPGDTVVVAKAGIVYVVGDVRLPSGIVMDKPEITVLQALALAQGPNPTAALDSARLIHHTPSGPKETPIPLKKILQAKSPDLTLQPDDIIFVPTSTGKTAARRSLEAIVQTATGLAIYRR